MQMYKLALNTGSYRQLEVSCHSYDVTKVSTIVWRFSSIKRQWEIPPALHNDCLRYHTDRGLPTWAWWVPYNLASYGILLEIFSSLLIFLSFSVTPAFTVSQPYYALGGQGQVSFHCTINTKSQPGEMQVSVYKGMYGEKRICSAYVNISYPHIATNGGVYCRGNVSRGKVDLTIFGLRGEDTDLYRCQIDIIFPPPYISKFGNGTLVHIPGKRCCWIWYSHSILMFVHPFTCYRPHLDVTAKILYLTWTFGIYYIHSAFWPPATKGLSQIAFCFLDVHTEV